MEFADDNCRANVRIGKRDAEEKRGAALNTKAYAAIGESRSSFHL
jgi:hypothetical protein